jgi:hypothetical protein
MTLRGLPPRLRWFIVVVATAGLLASVAVVLLEPGVWDRSIWPRLAVLLVLTAASEIAGLRLPHRGALEMLNLYEGMVVVNIALLPAGQAIAVSLGGAAGGPGRAAPGPGQGGLQPRHVRHRPRPRDRRLPPGRRRRQPAQRARDDRHGRRRGHLRPGQPAAHQPAPGRARGAAGLGRGPGVLQAVHPHLPGELGRRPDRGRPVAARAGGPPGGAAAGGHAVAGLPLGRAADAGARPLPAPVRGRPGLRLLAGAGGGAAQRPAQGGPAVRGRGGPSAVRPGRPAGRSGPSTAPRASASGRPTRPTWPPWPCSAPGPARWWAGPARPPRAGASCWSRP